MSAVVEVEAKVVTVALGDELNIYTVNELRDELSDRLPGNHRITIDLEQVAEIDSAGLQWLIAVKNLSPRHSVSFLNLSGPVKDFLSLLGLLNQFAIEESSGTGVES